MNGNWSVVLTDGDWDTRYSWYRHDLLETIVQIQWNVAIDTSPGRESRSIFNVRRNVQNSNIWSREGFAGG